MCDFYHLACVGNDLLEEPICHLKMGLNDIIRAQKIIRRRNESVAYTERFTCLIKEEKKEEKNPRDPR